MKYVGFKLIFILCAIVANPVFIAADTIDPLTYHDGFWITTMNNPMLRVPMTIINDMHIDLSNRRATVYAQQLVDGEVIAPPQVNPGECTTWVDGTTVCFHPNAVYLNGSGHESNTTAEGTGQWWVKHSWIVDGEGFWNCELPPKETYDDCFWVEGVLMEDGISMKIGNEKLYNIRTPLVEEDPVDYEVTRYENETKGFELHFVCKEEISVFDNQTRPCPMVPPPTPDPEESMSYNKHARLSRLLGMTSMASIVLGFLYY